MSMLDRFENAVEKGVNKVFSRVFRSGLKPVDISTALQRTAEDEALAVDGGEGIAPNEYVVQVATTDFSSLQQGDIDALSADLAEQLQHHIDRQGYALLGPIKVTLESNLEQAAGELEVTATRTRGAAAPATGVVATPEHPIIDVGGEKWLLTEEVTVLGRGSEADIAVNDTGVSRRHVEFRITPAGVILTDLGSTNGTFVEGQRVEAATLVDGNQVVIGRTPILFWTHAEQGGQ